MAQYFDVPEPTPQVAPPSPTGLPQNRNTVLWILVAVIVVIVLLCCFCALLAFLFFAVLSRNYPINTSGALLPIYSMLI
jgi:hypothetical protein